MTRCVPIRDPARAITGWVGTSIDIDDERAAALARDQARQRLQVVTNAMSIGVAQCNRQMEYVWVNPAYARLIGWPADQSRWLHARYTPIWNGDPAPIGWVVVIDDLTERRALEEQLRDTNHRKDA